MSAGPEGPQIRRVGVYAVRERVTYKYLPLFTDNGYKILLERKGRGARKVRASIISLTNNICHIEFANEEELIDGINRCNDNRLTPFAESLANAVMSYVRNWDEMALMNRIVRLYSLTPKLFNSLTVPTQQSESLRELNGAIEAWEPIKNRLLDDVMGTVKELRMIVGSSMSLGTNKELKDFADYLTECISKLQMFVELISSSNTLPKLDIILEVFRVMFSEEIADLLELIIACGLTLRYVDRSRGIINNRPVWLLIVSEPSSLKTTTMNMISKSPYVLIINDVTPAAFLPADPNQRGLVEDMHNRVTLIPSLSPIAEKKETDAREILSILESIYDGYYPRATAMGRREAIVDTVVIGALTTEIFETKFQEPLIAYGSRFLIYRYAIPSTRWRFISKLLQYPWISSLMSSLRTLISSIFTYLMESVTTDLLNAVVIPPSYERDLDVLAELMARLRVCFHRRIFYDPSSGSRIDEIEITQYDIPIRARMQLLNIARASAVVRSAPRFLGYPMVDLRAMQLCAKLAIAGSSKYLRDILLESVKHAGAANLTPDTLALTLKISKQTVYRYTEVLYRVGILIDTSPILVDPKYLCVIDRYLFGGRVCRGENSTEGLVAPANDDNMPI